MRELKIESFYKRLRESTDSSSSTPLLIFPSASDADSLCTLKIVTHILSLDSVRYSVYPVSSFDEILKFPNLDFQNPGQPVSMLLINWGCHRDMKKCLNLTSNSKVFVIDSHRPIHLHNLSNENEQVIVFYSKEDEEQADLVYDFDILALANASDLNSDDELVDDSDIDSDSCGDGGESESENRKRQRLSDKNNSNPVRLFGKLKKEYYKLGTFHGSPSGCVIFELAHSLRKNTNELLWLACVSLTDQLVHERLTNERYQAGVMELEQHINSSGNFDVISSVTLKDGTKVRAPENLRIFYDDEPRLTLLREWNLFESMLCSAYVATKLKTWSDKGTKKLMLLLARMGFPLVDCKKKFQYMGTEVKQHMKDKFDSFLPEYGLTDLYYRGFLITDGYCSKLSAADVVHGVTALLESFQEDKTEISTAVKFWKAYSTLSSNNTDLLKKGIQNAIDVQRAVHRQGSLAITKSGFIRSGSKFRWAKLQDPIDSEQLRYPQALTKFCYFLMDALKEKGAKMKPLICACSTKTADKVLIVGVCGKPRLGALRGNSFGIAFRSAAEETGAEYFHQLFESSWIVLDTVAVSSFMIRLAEMF